MGLPTFVRLLTRWEITRAKRDEGRRTTSSLRSCTSEMARRTCNTIGLKRMCIEPDKGTPATDYRLRVIRESSV